MTGTEPVSGQQNEDGQSPLSLGTAAARNLSTTTKTPPQMQSITSRWLLRLLPWVQATGGSYRVNRRLTYQLGDGLVTFSNTGSTVRVIPGELCELPALRGFDDTSVLEGLAERFEQREYAPGDVIAEAGTPTDEVVLVAHGKVNKLGTGPYGEQTTLGVLAGGEHFGGQLLADDEATWQFTAKAVTPCTVLALPRRSAQEVVERSDALRSHLEQVRNAPQGAHNADGESEVALASGHAGEPELPGTFVDYELKPREYELSVAQTVLRVHSRVADLYNEPMDQTEQQLRLTIQELREEQEKELVTNPEFGLLPNADLRQRIHTRTGPPTPDDMDELLSLVWKDPGFFLAHPRAIAAFGRECSRRGLYPASVDIGGHQVPAWRGVPIFPSNKLPMSSTRTTSIMLMRTGEANQGVVGLHQTGLPDEYEPGLSVRFMGINEKALISYLVSTYYSAAVLVPDALAVLDDVETGREG
ncbi:Cyclic nucleotide-binding domain-containing protein [Actinopolyspora mzabensis]|uniref:Cyclic nucleotide-binding domain-containing protein n=1 Tax=Actinopolyspora mzabensis TaxID=995066 RepID=A0A1G9A4A9_ACTMZ|nr:family 2B encapsulin nanocompartment shell protein [Actinopolyspora mzabensis]SDK22107.1 Cyclic nucleotide-binding domain-containing protein [Actinopolyspora mzabensis]